MVVRFDFESPALYNLTSELIWPDVIQRARTHPNEVIWRDPRSGGCALHRVCRYQEPVDVVREMLENVKSAATVKDKDGSTPLHIACYHGSAEMVELLLAANPEASIATDKRGRTPLHVACSSYTADPDALRFLVKANPAVVLLPDKDGNTPVSLLCERHSGRMVAVLDTLGQLSDESNDKPKKRLAPFWKQLHILLHGIVDKKLVDLQTGEWKLVHALATIPDCPTILFELALKLHPEQTKELVHGNLPLHLAAECPASQTGVGGDGLYVGCLTDINPVACEVKDRLGRLPFQIAVEHGKTWEHVLSKLLELFPEAISERHQGMLPLLLSALPEKSALDDPKIGHIKKTQHNQITTLFEILRCDPSALKNCGRRMPLT